MALQIKRIPVTEWEQNCRIVFDSETLDAVVVDPGGDASDLLKEIQAEGLNLKAIWLTHSHLDHCGGVADIKQKFDIPLYGSKNESEFRSNVEQLVRMYGVSAGGMQNCPEPEHFLEAGQQLHVGEHAFSVLFVPGHSPGHMAFYNAANSVLLAGDTVFKGSIGRSDLPGGNHQQLIDSIKTKILSLPAQTKILPGHGDDTSVAFEAKHNPFLK